MTTESDPRENLATALATRHEGAFVFQCPACHKRLSSERISYEEPLECGSCRCQFFVTTAERRAREREIRLAERRRRQAEEQRLKQEVAQLRESGEPLRDEICILGRPQSGKSVYLAVLYRQLWTSQDDLIGRTVNGRDHEALLTDFDDLNGGRWLPATAAMRQCDLSLNYKGRRVSLATMDYPGEVFRQLFYHNRIDTPELESLHDQIESAMAVMLLIDPEQAIKGERETLDLEFSCVQVAEQLQAVGMERNFLVILTKRDRNFELVKSHGGPREFVEKVMPRLYRTTPSMLTVHLSAVQTKQDADGKSVPAFMTDGIGHTAVPLRKLLDRVGDDHLKLLQAVEDDVIEEVQSGNAITIIDTDERIVPIRDGDVEKS